MGAFAILSLIAAALPIVQQLEQLIVGARRGQVKKDSAVKIITGGLDIARQQGAMSDEHAKQIGDVAGQAVDLAVGILNDAGVLKHAAPEAA